MICLFSPPFKLSTLSSGVPNLLLVSSVTQLCPTLCNPINRSTPGLPLHHHSSKASILRHSAFFTVQLSDPYMTTGKTVALTRQTFVGKIMALLLNMLSSTCQQMQINNFKKNKTLISGYATTASGRR